MSKRTIGFILIFAGVIGFIVFLGADAIGIGTYPGINGTQIAGTIAGVVVLAIGVWMVLKNMIKK